MNRRTFLIRSSSGLGLALAASQWMTTPARAFTTLSCDAASGTRDCQEITRHTALLAELQSKLDHMALSEEAKRLYLASITCPVCGQPLVS